MNPRRVIYAAALLRAVGVGLTGVTLGLYLSLTGLDARHIGFVVAAGLAGGAAGTWLVGLWAEVIGRRRTLMALSGLAAAGGVALAMHPAFPLLLAAVFTGMVNGMGRDRGAVLAVEQALLPAMTDAKARTQTFAWYNVVLDIGHTGGSLLAGLPFLLRRWWGVETLASYQHVFLLYATLNVLSGVLYLWLPADVAGAARRARPTITPAARATVGKLAGLFAIDSLGSGFLTGALVSYWFHQRFGVGEELLGPLFGIARVANACSHLAAAWLARRIGLLNTMVFTHLPSNACLIATACAPSLSLAVMWFLLREILVEMDVPTRQSYVVAVVRPEERTFATSMTTLTRNVGWAVAPACAGYAMGSLALGAPLVLGGAIKAVYDVCLYTAFRRVKPEEER